MIKNKRIGLSILLLIFLITVIIYPLVTFSRIKPYYSGDAISFEGKTFISSTNMDEFELFVVENNKIVKKSSLTSYWYEGDKYFDSLFNIESGKLFIYLVNGKYLYKYRVYSNGELKLAEKTKTHDFKWFIRLGKTEDRIVVITKERARYWSFEGIILDEFLVESSPDGNIYPSIDNKNIFSVMNNKLNIFDNEKRKVVKEIPLNIENEKVYRNVVSDVNNVYVVDDYSLKAFDFSGKLQKEFKFSADFGYTVRQSVDDNYLYFSDGIGVVKMDKKTFKPVDWAHTMNMASNSWAIDIKNVGNKNNEQIVVFNNANIMLLDKNLELVDYYASVEATNKPIKDLKLERSAGVAYSGDLITVNGEGFGLNEVVVIELAREKFRVATDAEGNFEIKIKVPKVDKPQKTDIRATGESTGVTFSVNFEIL